MTLGLMAAVIGVALLTSALSGVLGMGGGMILMAFLRRYLYLGIPEFHNKLGAD